MDERRRLRIAVSINGEGRGHLTRMTALALRLGKRHELAFWCPDTIREELSRTFSAAKIHEVPSLLMRMNGPEVNYLGTAIANMSNILSAGAVVSRLAGELAEFRADGVLSDLEPYLPEAATRLRLPILQLNHPGIVTRYPSNEPDALVAKLVVSRLMGSFDRLVLSSFYGGDIGPILRPEILRARRFLRRGDYVLVYAKEGFERRIRDFLDRVPYPRFRFFPNPAEDFPSALAGCRAVIATSGHQMTSEALYLGKPVFVVPLAGQYEQRLNALMLLESGRGTWAPADAFEEPLGRFLAELETRPWSAKPGMKIRVRDYGPQAVRIVERFFRGALLRGREARTRYVRITWPMGRLVPVGPR